MKKKELDELTSQVIDVQYTVDQLQATVTSVSSKSQKILVCLSVSEADRARALINKNLVDKVVENALTLRDNSLSVFAQMGNTNAATKQMAKDTKDLMDKLIYSAEMINKLSMLIIRKKALNPLISDELVSIVNAAGKDANNACALTLVALRSTFAAQASCIESEAATALEYSQAILLYQVLTGKVELTEEDGKNNNPEINSLIAEAEAKNKKMNKNRNRSQNNDDPKTCLKDLLNNAYVNAKSHYDLLYTANGEITKQLNAANAKSNKAQITLKSLQSGLAAATAAALAS